MKKAPWYAEVGSFAGLLHSQRFGWRKVDCMRCALASGIAGTKWEGKPNLQMILRLGNIEAQIKVHKPIYHMDVVYKTTAEGLRWSVAFPCQCTPDSPLRHIEGVPWYESSEEAMKAKRTLYQSLVENHVENSVRTDME